MSKNAPLWNLTYGICRNESRQYLAVLTGIFSALGMSDSAGNMIHTYHGLGIESQQQCVSPSQDSNNSISSIARDMSPETLGAFSVEDLKASIKKDIHILIGESRDKKNFLVHAMYFEGPSALPEPLPAATEYRIIEKSTLSSDLGRIHAAAYLICKILAERSTQLYPN